MFYRILGFILVAVLFTDCHQDQDQIDFKSDVAPIIRTHCTSCHNPKGSAPFTLFDYEDVASRSKTILSVLRSGYMPPWYADSSFRHFKNERYLSKKEIETIEQWVQEGKKKGGFDFERWSAYSYASTMESVTYPLGEPFSIPGDNKEYFVKFIVPFENSEPLNVRAVEFIPGARKFVHHANYGIYPVPEETDFDDYDFEPIYSDLYDEKIKQYEKLLGNMRFYLGWIPGSGPVEFDPGYGFTLPKKGVILFTLHYAPTPKEETDHSSVRFYYDKSEIEKPLYSISIGSGGIGRIVPKLEIAPNRVDTFSLRETIPFDLRIHYLWPHMHLIGQAFESSIIDRNDTIPLVRIPKWSFEWQEGYKLTEPLTVKKGSQITVTASYDNTAANPNNPFSPPQTIYSTGLMETKKEMMTLVLLYSRK